MKQKYELAKREGLNWQSLIVQDLEFDVRLIVIKGVKNGEEFGSINSKVTRLITEELKEVESQAVKDMARQALYQYASRVYVQAVQLFMDSSDVLILLTALSNSGYLVPDSISAPIRKQTKASAGEFAKVEYLDKKGQTPLTSENLAYNRATANAMYDKEYGADVLKRTNALLTSVAKVDYSKYASLRASVERQIRWEWHQKRIQDVKESGNQLAWIDSHSNCSKRCQPFQGRLYSLNNTSGEIDGIKYVPLEVATDVIDKYGWKNGCLSGFNCRHNLVPYKAGFRPQTIPSKVIDHQREVDSKMRYFERNVRNYESLCLGYKELGQKKLYSHYRNLAKKWTEAYNEYARKENVPTYPSRLKV